MRIGALIRVEQSLEHQVRQVASLAESGFASAWAVQIFGRDALSVLAVVGVAVDGIDLGTAVVPVYPRHPQVLAQQALTVQEAVGGRLSLGIGLSHQVVVEGMWGYPFTRPASFMEEYLDALVPMLHGEAVHHEGEQLKAITAGPLDISGVPAPSLLVAALGPVMLRLAGRTADGTVTWMTGTRTIAEHVAPTIAAAAEAAGRPAPRVVVSLPITLTDDVDAARQRIDRAFALYPSLPSYKAMLDREGVAAPSEISLVGPEHDLDAALDRLADAGATEYVASPVGSHDEQERTIAYLAARAAG